MRILHYSRDTYGASHLERTLSIASRFASDFPHATQLVVSGTPQPGWAKLPGRLDFIKLPTMDESLLGDFHSPSLSLSYGAIASLREKIILGTIKHFQPDLVLVESSTNGQGEMSPALEYLEWERPETKLIVGMSDTRYALMHARKTLRACKVAVGTQIQSVLNPWNKGVAFRNPPVSPLTKTA